ncbi:MAG: OmpA family protein [Bacteroidaceae bacterium]|nr:OmpA family protein [Bacteroidaceae bacterium]
MKTFRLFLTITLGLVSLSVSSQNIIESSGKFAPHWDWQLGFGAQYTLGELSFEDLLSPNAQVGAGFWFSPVFGVRGTVNAWQSKAGIKEQDAHEQWSWYYVAPQVDATLNLSNLLLGFNSTRKVEWLAFGGLGANIAFENTQASEAMDRLYSSDGIYAYMNDAHKQQNLDMVWTGTKAFAVIRVGTAIDFRCSEHVAIGIEAQANTLSDSYNSKGVSNTDWYFNTLAGIKFSFGSSRKRSDNHNASSLLSAGELNERPFSDNIQTEDAVSQYEVSRELVHDTVFIEKPVEVVVEKPVEVVVEKPVEVVVEKPVEVVKIVDGGHSNVSFVRNIFFTINMEMKPSELKKVGEIASFMAANPATKVHMVGYADGKTGSILGNKKMSERRVRYISQKLVAAGVEKERISTEAVGSKEQPFGGDEYFRLNRVVICTVE